MTKEKIQTDKNWQYETGWAMAFFAICLFILTFFEFGTNLWKVSFSMGFVFSIVSYILIFIGQLREKWKHIKWL